MELYDTHFHLDDSDNAEEIVANAREAGVENLNLISCDLKETERNMKIAGSFDKLYTTAGVHPLHVKDFDMDFAGFHDFLKEDLCVAVGEIGLDYYYDKDEETITKQKKTFYKFLELSAEYQKPAIIHCRDAFEDCYNAIKDVLQGQQPFIIHCYTGGAEWAEKFVELGGYISYSGICTFKNAQEIRDSLKVVPQDRILVETDSPYLAPVPHRGKRNQPAYVAHVLEKVAAELEMLSEKAAELTTANAKKVFKID